MINIELIVRGVCIRDGKLLIAQTRGASNTFLPGGHIEEGEDARTALQREMLEEMGLEVTVGEYLGTVEHTFEGKIKLTHEMNLLFCFTLPEGAEVKAIEPQIDFLWVTPDENSLKEKNLQPWVMISELIKYAQNSTFVPFLSTIGKKDPSET